MAVLKHRIPLIAVAAFSAVPFSSVWAAEIPHLINGYDITGSSSIAGGYVYTLGAAASLRFGAPDDLSNNPADTHFNYTSDIAPATPSDPNSPMKHSDNWGGGIKIELGQGWNLGVDLDGLNDNFENLSTNGQKLTLGCEPFKISYRFARSLVSSSLLVGNTTLNGLLIYQHTFEGDFNWVMSEQSSILFDGSYALFNPPAPNLGTFLNAPALTTYSTFQDTLASFEQWRVGGVWNMVWNDYIDTSFSGHVSHEIIPANPLIDMMLTFGYQLSQGLHIQAGWEYSHDPQEALNTASIELRWSWDRQIAAVYHAKTEAYEK